MTLTVPTPSNSFFEPPAESAALPVRAWLQDNGVDGFDFVTSGSRDGAFVDVDSSGEYELLDLTNRLYFVTDGAGGITLAISGTPIAHLIDDGAGGYEISSDFEEAEAAVLYASQDGSYWLAPTNATNGIEMIAVDSTLTLYI